MNVLYVDHTSVVDGPQRLLIGLLARLPPTIAPSLMCPDGPLADLARGAGVRVIELPRSGGRRRTETWPAVAGAAADLSSAVAVLRAARAIQADLVHGVSTSAGLTVAVARRLGGPPTVVDLRGAMPADGAVALLRTLQAVGDAVITTAWLPSEIPPAGPPGVVHEPYHPASAVAHAATMTKAEARRASGLPTDAMLAGVIAELTPWKGQDTAIKALRLMREHQPAARLLIVGETAAGRGARYDNVSFERWLYRLVRGLGIESSVEFRGPCDDVPTIIRALDVLLAPSWQEPVGRTVIEAMALETAVIATNVGRPAELITHGVDGVLLPPRADRAWAVATERLLRDASLRIAMSKRGAQTVSERFGADDSVTRILEVYDQVLGRSATTRLL